jgi:hypothetical protein
MTDPMDEADFSAVPLFPLPNVVLFPRAVLPLHIFEERYKVMMIADVLKNRRQIAMGLLRPGWEMNYHGKAPIEPVVCVGTILSHERLADGRYNLLLQGTARARMVRELEHQPYRVAQLRAFEQEPLAEDTLEEERRRLTTIFEDPQLSDTGIGRRFVELLAKPIPISIICDLAAFHFLEDIQLKQKLLADFDVRHRIGRTIDALEEVYCELAQLQAAAPINCFKNPSLN